MKSKLNKRIQRKARVRAKIFGTSDRPRLSVFKSNTHIYGQIVDDSKGKTLVATSDLKLKGGNKTELATKVGEEIATLATAKKIKKVTFDRNGFLYHGRIKAAAEGARKGGLEF